MSPHSTPYPLPPELVLVGRYVCSVAHLLEMPELDTHELAWAAGFFDGEGCTYLLRYGPAKVCRPRLDMAQIHAGVLHRFQKAVGGLGSLRERRKDPRPQRQRQWIWYTSTWQVTQSVLVVLWPYLSDVKREQAARVFAAYQEQVEIHPQLGQGAVWPTPRRGSATWNAKLTEEVVGDIRARVARGESQATIAREFGVASSTICNLVHGWYWKHVPGAIVAAPSRRVYRKLTAEMVREMRRRHAEDHVSRKELAKAYGVAYATVAGIIARTAWTHRETRQGAPGFSPVGNAAAQRHVRR